MHLPRNRNLLGSTKSQENKELGKDKKIKNKNKIYNSNPLAPSIHLI
jgi:hypothetical protein